MLTRDDFLRASLKRETVTLPDGAEVGVRELTAYERRILFVDTAGRKEGDPLPPDFVSKVLACGVVDNAGQNLFSVDDVPALNTLPEERVKAPYEAIMRLSGWGAGEAQEENP